MDAKPGESDQLVAVAISASDLLVEINPDGVIAFIAGAVHRLGVSQAQTPVGLSFYDLFQADDRSSVREHVARVADGSAVTPLLVRLRRGGAQSMLFGGCALPQGRTIVFMGIGDYTDTRGTLPNLARETERGLMSRPVFTALAMRRLPEDLAGALRLTFVELRGYGGLSERVLSAMSGGLSAAIARELRLSGPGIEAIGELGRGRFGVLHRNELNLEAVRRSLATLVQAASPGDPVPLLLSTSMQPGRDGTHGPQAARVLRYAIERFASGSESAEGGEEAGLGRLFPDTLSRVTQLEHAIEQGAFDLAYQPIVDLGDRQPRHAEALLRLGNGTSPLVAIAAAEAAGMIADFDLAICARAIERIERQNGRALPVAVNLSGRSLESRGFVERLQNLLESRPVPAGRLMFELTESAILGEVERVNEVVQQLRRRGYRFCLDDLGSGANSFHYLRSIPVDFVKIDGAFGRDALKNERDRSFLRYVSGFCRENDILAIAEMIETEAEAEGFRELGIDYGQGYLFGRPEIRKD